MSSTEGGQSLQPMSAPWSNNVSSTAESTVLPAYGAATWPPSAASSSVTSHMDSSAAAPITEINLVSSPPTSHAASPPRRSSPLRPSSVANILESPSVMREAVKMGSVASPSRVASIAQMDAYVANSDPEDGAHAIDTDGADTPQNRRSPSPSTSKAKDSATRSFADGDAVVDGSSVYVHIPASSPSILNSSTKKKTAKHQTEKPRRRGSDASDSAQVVSSPSILDDAAYAAALAAQEETLARRRPTRSARKEISYSPECDLDGRPLRSKKEVNATASGSSSTSKAKPVSKDAPIRKIKIKRRSRTFSDDDDEEEEEEQQPRNHSESRAESSANAGKPGMPSDEDNADLTDEDIGFQARQRKKPRVSNAISVDSDEEAVPTKTSTKLTSRKRVAADDHDDHDDHDEDDEDALTEEDGHDDILTPPAPASPRRSSRKSVPSPKKQQLKATAKKGKGRQSETFELAEQEKFSSATKANRDEEQQPRSSTRQNARGRRSPSPNKDEEEKEEGDEEQPAPKSSSPATAQPKGSSSSSSAPASASIASPAVATASAPHAPPQPQTPAAPTSVAIKRITTTTTATSKSASPSSSSSSSSPVPNARASSFFGKPLTTLLTPNAARRPGLTRKTKIPSLLNHRGVPKPPAPKLTVSKRRMQDDDYEYDAEYEALIAKDKKGSDDEDDEDDNEREEKADEGEEEREDIEVEYD